MSTNNNNNTTTPNPIPASFLRGGTSKGIFLNRSSLPSDHTQWDRIFLGLMGSPDAQYGRQLNGMGGGISSLSKICIVGAPSPAQKAQGIDAEYTFAQVGIRESQVDYSGNCGNLSSVVGVFAVDEGICAPRIGVGARGTVRSFNTNTRKIIDTTFPVTHTHNGPTVAALELPETTMAGVPGEASTIVLDFINPSGARTGTLLPTGSPTDTLQIHLPLPNTTTTTSREVRVSCVDATNPTVFVSHSELSAFLPLSEYLRTGTGGVGVGEALETIRQTAALKMGLDPSAQAQPKICILSDPHTNPEPGGASEGVGAGSGVGTGEGAEVGSGAEVGVGAGGRGADIAVHALSMGALHKAVPMTVGLCLGVASSIEGTLAWEIVRRSRSPSPSPSPNPNATSNPASEKNEQSKETGKDEKSKGSEGNEGMIRISHPSGVVDVGAEFAQDGSVTSAKVVRTGRRLMRGVVWW